MRTLFVIQACLLTYIVAGQSLKDKYLHYRKDHYWDSTIYKSELYYYLEQKNNVVTQHDYPVLRYWATMIVSDTPLITKDSFYRPSEWPKASYKYERKQNTIYLKYFNRNKNRTKEHKQYSLSRGDTVHNLADVSSSGRDGITINGFSIYLGEKEIILNGKNYKTYCFLEDHNRFASHSSHHKIEVYLEQKTLIALKIITTRYDFDSGQKSLYSSIEQLESSSNQLPDYKNTKESDLILFENQSKAWTTKQKEVFIKMFKPEDKKFAECILNKLDGHITFYRFEENNYFKWLLRKQTCE